MIQFQFIEVVNGKQEVIQVYNDVSDIEPNMEPLPVGNIPLTRLKGAAVKDALTIDTDNNVHIGIVDRATSQQWFYSGDLDQWSYYPEGCGLTWQDS